MKLANGTDIVNDTNKGLQNLIFKTLVLKDLDPNSKKLNLMNPKLQQLLGSYNRKLNQE